MLIFLNLLFCVKAVGFIFIASDDVHLFMYTVFSFLSQKINAKILSTISNLGLLQILSLTSSLPKKHYEFKQRHEINLPLLSKFL